LLEPGRVRVANHLIEDRPVWPGEHDRREAVNLQGTGEAGLVVGIHMYRNEPRIEHLDNRGIAQGRGVEFLAPDTRLGAEVDQQRPPTRSRRLPGCTIVAAPRNLLPRNRQDRRDQE